MGFINLHNHSEFTFLGSLISLESLVEFSISEGFGGVAICDTLSTYGFFKLTKLCAEYNLKAIYGIKIFTQGVASESQYPLILYALNNQGLENIFWLNSEAHRLFNESKSYTLPYKTIHSHSRGLAVLVEAEILANTNDFAIIEKIIERYKTTFGDNFFIEVNHTGNSKENLIGEINNIVSNFQLNAIGTCEARYFVGDDEAFAFLNSHRQKSLDDNEKGIFIDTNLDFSVRTKTSMQEIFAEHPEYLQNAQQLYNKIRVHLDIKSLKIPKVYKHPEKLKALCLTKLEKLGLSSNISYIDRLDMEIKQIEDLELNHFFLIIGEIARFMKQKNIPYGWGRGSAVSSLVLYLLGITKVDPVVNNLMFERFLNPGRKELPDIDIDVCWRRRGEVFDFIAEKYGHQNVGHIATIDRMMVRSAIREISKTFHLSHTKLDKILHLIPHSFHFSRSLSSIIENNSKLQYLIEHDKDIKSFLGIAAKIEGISSHSSVHAGGVIVLPEGINQYASTELSRTGQIVAQITKDDLENTGFIKIDLLGLRFITIVYETIRRVNIKQIDFNNEKAYELLIKGDTTAVFQLESAGMRSLLRKIRPDTIQRLSDVIALYRPGPIKSGMTDKYVKRRTGIEPETKDIHLSSITQDTYGFIVYQEQVLMIAHNLAGMSWERADILRKALSSKKHQLILDIKDEFIAGCTKNGIAPDYAMQLFGILVDFGSYGFNKAHSTAYAYNAYAGAYLKANYPLEYMLASLNNNIGFSSRLNRYIADIKYHNISILPVDINHSEIMFNIEDGKIRAGFAIIKYVGRKLARSIIEERRHSGQFRDFLDCYLRMKNKGLNIKAAEYLILAGAFDNEGFSRNMLLATLDEISKIKIKKIPKPHKPETPSLFDSPVETPKDDIPTLDSIVDDISKSNIEHSTVMEMENKATGLFLSYHPIDAYDIRDINHFNPDLIGDMDTLDYAVVIAYLYRLRKTKTRNKANMAYGLLSDNTGIVETIIYPKTFLKFKHIIHNNKVYLVKGKVEENKLLVSEIYLFDKLIER